MHGTTYADSHGPPRAPPHGTLDLRDLPDLRDLRDLRDLAEIAAPVRPRMAPCLP
ncbi:hypothetical protein ABZS76_33655 [Streptomyces sp. NPDC005562]|uniref:hypothetical protein n=1 Tax=Streptomyces sp. NPDC005562 TaxID=3154890 RepID=UPI00339EAD0C